MIRPICTDTVLLAKPAARANNSDLQTARDLADTLLANRSRCVGMAANMIGQRKRIIAIVKGPMIITMLNPKILSKSGEYEAEEGCLSLAGTRKTKRYQSIRLSWQDVNMKQHTGVMDGFEAQIVQHEVDHCDGILI